MADSSTEKKRVEEYGVRYVKGRWSEWSLDGNGIDCETKEQTSGLSTEDLAWLLEPHRATYFPESPAPSPLAARWRERAADTRTDGEGLQWARVAECLEDCADELDASLAPSPEKTATSEARHTVTVLESAAAALRESWEKGRASVSETFDLAERELLRWLPEVGDMVEMLDAPGQPVRVDKVLPGWRFLLDDNSGMFRNCHASNLRRIKVSPEKADGDGWVSWAWACLDAYYLRENIAWPVFAELNDSESWVVMRNGDPIGWSDTDPNVARVMAAKHLYAEDPTSLPPPPTSPDEKGER